MKVSELHTRTSDDNEFKFAVQDENGRYYEFSLNENHTSQLRHALAQHFVLHPDSSVEVVVKHPPMQAKYGINQQKSNG